MQHRMRFAVAVAVVMMLGCKSAQVHSMARTARLADLRFSDEYTAAADNCVATSDGWDQYDECMEPWQSAYEAMRIFFATTHSLDIAKGRTEFREAGCSWYRSMQVVDATSPVVLPSVETGLSSKWRRRCGK